MNKTGKLTIVTFAFGFLVFALIYYAFYVVPNTGSLNAVGGTGTFWGRYGYSPSANNNLSIIGGQQKESNVTSLLVNMQCALTKIDGVTNVTVGDTSIACPQSSMYDDVVNFIRFMVLGAYQALIALFNVFGSFRVLISQLSLLIGIPVDIINVIIGGVTLTIFISWIIFIFNRSFEQ